MFYLGATVYLSTPTEYWETRGEPIQEGPVGYTYANRTYITYSGSASWISDDYSGNIIPIIIISVFIWYFSGTTNIGTKRKSRISIKLDKVRANT